MSLIEQLGGYELTKQVFDSVPKDGSSYTVTRDDTGAAFHSGEIFKALLEYRRQHNIYEESDKIVFIDDFMHNELMVVVWTRKGEVWMDEGAKRCTDLSMIRHATDEEIKAGRRL